MSLLADMRTLLVTAGHVTAGTFYERIIPDTPDAIVAYYDSPAGRGADRTHSLTAKILFPRFQIRARGTRHDTDPDTAETLIKSIHDELDGKANTTLASGRRALLIEAVGYYGFLRRDHLGRAEYVANFEAQMDS